ncbi:MULTISPECIES: arylsulfatase [unclassified Fusibacter]|uniref:arylsulfatase n=1 Tax=unclassified Fusibacter TaxID=2624464 RepID=UPI0013E9803B|nr:MULTISPECIES: arylsulfatase [unclassified Fusibacter]MCK8061699.1 arylsulfatase [Fusibacter sp. A2]NPE23868.1 arylsulfatase [Fusibacter sp. A1]
MHKSKILSTLLVCSTLTINSFSYAATAYSKDDYLDKINPPDDPNVVVILVDDLGFTDLGVYGSEIKTPNIDRLANQGVKFSNFHTSASCAPSRAMLLTGVDNHLAGVPNIPEALPPEQASEDNYQGVLSNNVATVASILNDDGYHTYMTGKWHLGKTKENLPYNRGFERTLSMADTGADNWEQRPYMSMYDHAHWTKDGKEIQLEAPFYSSELLVDEMIGFIDSNMDDGKPFFSYVSFLAVHMPVQAPEEFTDMYLETYEEGWTALRDSRYGSAKEIGLVPKDSDMLHHDFIDDWDDLSEEEKEFEAKRMAVYAGMVSAMDYNVGRLIDYLEAVGQLENTIFIITSDNGPDGASMADSEIQSMGYTHNYHDLGEIGSFNYIDQNFASAAASPLTYFKFYSGEGGLRVPLIFTGPGIDKREGFQNAFTHVTDITPTILEMTDTEAPEGRFSGREVEPITGKNLTPILKGTKDSIYSEDDYVGYEVAGNLALFNNGYKLMLNRPSLGDSEWYLFDIVNDPGETKDLKYDNPVQFQHMMNLYQRYTKEKGVLPVPDNYNQIYEVSQKIGRKKLGNTLVVLILVFLTTSIFALFGRQKKILYKETEKIS